MNETLLTQHGHTDLRADVDRVLREHFAERAASAESFGLDFSILWKLAGEQVHGGKLVRPLLFLQVLDALTPNSELDRGDAIRIAAAIEALHFAFLLHDDVIDGDTYRRGRRNLIGELLEYAPEGVDENAKRHWARSGGILAGNLLLSGAHQLIARVDVPHETRLRLLDLLESTIFSTTAGEFADVGLSDGILTPDLGSILAMTVRKTAIYSFELPLRAAAILSGAPHEREALLSASALHLGAVYQLQDDLLSTLGDATLHGKDPYSDLREGKETALISFARMSDTWPEVADDFGNAELTVERAQVMRDHLRSSGAEDAVRGIIQEELQALRGSLAAARPETLPPAVRDILLDLASCIDGRTS